VLLSLDGLDATVHERLKALLGWHGMLDDSVIFLYIRHGGVCA
jgi:hypothetical protein